MPLAYNGGGGGSIAAWLAERCGLSGHVLVTDIDLRFLMQSAALDQPMIEIQRHDILADPLPEQTFDLIHARLVLFHVPAREQALEHMVAALKPGGWIVIEDFDRNFMDFSYPSTNAQGAALYQKMQAALGQLMEARGVDPTWGRSLYRRLRAHGLGNVGMEVRAWLVRTSSRFDRRPQKLGSSPTRRSHRCSHCLMTLNSLSVPTSCSVRGVVGPNLSLPPVRFMRNSSLFLWL